MAANYSAQSDEDKAVVEKAMRMFDYMLTERSTVNEHCEDVAALIMPSHVNTFYYGAYNTPGEKKTDKQVDATGMLALSRFASICDSLLTPRNLIWHELEADSDFRYLAKDKAVKDWFYMTTRKLFKHRYAPVANFSAQNQAIYRSLGAFGTGVMFVDQFYDITRGAPQLRYKAIPYGNIYLGVNHQGLYDRFIRIMKPSAYQMAQVREWQGNLPTQVIESMERYPNRQYTVLHCCWPREDYAGDTIGPRAQPWVSYYICVESKSVLQKTGYYTFPIAASRYQQAPGEDDGRGVAMDVLPSLKTLNAEKKVFLKQGHRAADPVLLLMDDGLMNMNLRPGAQNKGAWSADGKALVGTLPAGDIQISEEMMQQEKDIINEAFFVTIFQVMFENPQMTATQVVEIVNEKGILVAPTIGRQGGEYLGPMVEREIDLLAQLRLLDPMPPALVEAGGSYSVRYTNPMAKAMRAGEAAGFARTLEMATQVANVTQDPSVFDPFEFDIAIPDIADIQSVPSIWMSSRDSIERKRAARAKQVEEEKMIQAAPAAAAMMKARAQSGQPQEGAV